MIEILESEYQKALEENQKNQKIIDRYLETQKCKCDDLVHKTEYNTHTVTITIMMNVLNAEKLLILKHFKWKKRN